MPQTYDAGAVFLAQVVLKHNELSQLENATRLSQVQLSRLRYSMERSHRKRLIPAGDNRYLKSAKTDGRYDLSRMIIIDDEKLHYIWSRFKEHAVTIANVLAKRPDGLSIANQIVVGFKSPECRDLLAQYRQQYDRRYQGNDARGAELRRIILTLIVNRISRQSTLQASPISQNKLLQELFGL